MRLCVMIVGGDLFQGLFDVILDVVSAETKKTVTMGQVNHASTGVYVVWLSTSKTAGDVLEWVSVSCLSACFPQLPIF